MSFTFGNVQVEEVTIENGLHATGHDGDQIKEALEVEPVHPVQQVQRAVRP